MELAANSVVSGRFLIERLADSGGMGLVYRAIDLTTGEPVALKLLHEMNKSPHQVDRFLHEAALLAELRHPGIVAYLAHGYAEGGQPFLAMEWLEGETLGKSLTRGPLEPQEAIDLVRNAAEALAVAHAHGVIHRDLKPENLFLRGGDPRRVLVLDFGIARREAGAQELTRTGTVLGTPGYMAPEQVRAERDVGPSADVFALGCVLFECLTGQPLFLGESALAVLARILLDQPRALRSVRPDLPPSLEALIARMVAQEPKERPRDADALLAAMADLDGLAADPAVGERAPLLRLAPRMRAVEEQSVFSVVLAAPSGSLAELPTIDVRDAEQTAARFEVARAALTRLGMQVERLIDGSVLATHLERQRTTAKEQAAQAARCALLLHEHLPDMLISVATGRGSVSSMSGGIPVGEGLDRVSRLHATRIAKGAQELVASPSVVLLDDATAGLLDGRFRVERLGAGVFALQGAEAGADESRLLLGKPTPCVGRERELEMLDLVLAGCVEGPSACAVVVTAPPGVGKSRLRHEFLRRLAASGREGTSLIGRGDPMSAGSSYGLLPQALRDFFGVTDASEPAAQRARVMERVALRIPGRAGQEVAIFLAELCKIPVADDDIPELRSARQDPHVLSEQISHAFVAYLGAECEAQPVLLVLEDLHWGDALTVRLIDTALRELAHSPFMVLALARPEVRELFPGLWENRSPQEIKLAALHKRACEHLVKEVLGPGVEPRRVERIVEQSTGNALFLEELIRAAAEGEGDELPRTVLTMLQSRLLRLEPGARRALCAASVFGETFWRGGVQALLGSEEAGEGIDRALVALTAAELIKPRRTSRLAGEVEYAFRHALMRDAAYTLMTGDSQAVGHAMAGAYLERALERDPLVLAEHYERGRELSRAGHFYALAAEQAHWACDSGAEEALAKRGLACDVPGKMRERLLALLTESQGWRSQWTLGDQYAEQLLQMSSADSLTWVKVLPLKIMVSVLQGRSEELVPLLTKLRSIEPSPETAGNLAFTLMACIDMLPIGGRVDLAEPLFLRMREVIEPLAEQSPLVRGWMHSGFAWWRSIVEDDHGAALGSNDIAVPSLEEAGHRRGALLARIKRGINLSLLGRRAEAERELQATRTAGDQFGPMHAFRMTNLIVILLDRGALPEARREAEGFLAAAVGQGLGHDEGLARLALAEVCRREGDLARAEMEARQACAITQAVPLDQLPALSTLAAVLLATSRVDEARASAALAVERYEALRVQGMRGSFARLVLAESLEASGDRGGARAVIGAARARLLTQAARLDGEEARRSFLLGVPENARIISLAEAWEATSRSTSTSAPEGRSSFTDAKESS